MVYLLDKHIFLLRIWKVFKMLYTFVFNETFLTLLQDYFKHLWPSWVTSTTFNSKVWRYDMIKCLKVPSTKRNHHFRGLQSCVPQKTIKSTRFIKIWTQSMLTFSSLWNLKTLTSMAHLSFTPSCGDAAQQFKWTFTGSQHIQSATLIFSLTTPRARKDQWLTRYYFVQETFHAQVKANGRKGDEEKRCFEKTTTHLALSMNVKEGNKIS